jgi:hypothetical protein
MMNEHQCDQTSFVEACIVSDGYDCDAARVVGQVMNKARLTRPEQTLTAIALSKWGVVEKHHQILMNSNKTLLRVGEESEHRESFRAEKAFRVITDDKAIIEETHDLLQVQTITSPNEILK